MEWNELTAQAVRVGVIVGGGTIAYLVMRAIRARILRIGDSATNEAHQRRKTLASVFTTVGIVIILAISIMMILQEVGITLGPLLATAGVAGLAIGFGAQTLVKDVISGIFILFENQFLLGDVIETASVSGAVEEINLRTTVLRDVHGVVHVVPNGEIRVLSNKTKGWSRAVLEVGVGYNEDIDRTIEVLREVCADLYNDPEFGALLLEEPTVPGVEAFGESAIMIRVMAKTVPLKQWDVAREFRKRIKQRFDDEGIEIPYPQRTVWHRSDPAAPPRPALSEPER